MEILQVFLKENTIRYSANKVAYLDVYIADTTKSYFIKIKDDEDNVIGSAFYLTGSGESLRILLNPKKEGSYSISLEVFEVTINFNEILFSKTFENILFLNEDNVGKDLILENKEKFIFLDLNYWLSKCINEYSFLKDLFANMSGGIFGHTIWDSFDEEIFIPRVFSEKSLFRVLFVDTNIPPGLDKIDHYISFLEQEKINYLPFNLKLCLEMFYNKIDFLVLRNQKEDESLESILIDKDEEYGFLESLLLAKKYTYLDKNAFELPYTNLEFDYMLDHFNTFTPLMKLIAIELFYFHYNFEDDFFFFDELRRILKEDLFVLEKKEYAFLCYLYGLILLNKILHLKIINDENLHYSFDYWKQ